MKLLAGAVGGRTKGAVVGGGALPEDDRSGGGGFAVVWGEARRSYEFSGIDGEREGEREEEEKRGHRRMIS
ncbi:hypothetical protein K7X08_020510 [Anisodus acutangulus]|uniref:Uncharacterized protein n=1 Tax=Anisodus acutangulus TaxID=402998 RepID=A0A9Q1REL0_9SOLA|nr:hypothetical protein K7X08_020510 [Anisodus acutangulus]